MGRSHPVILTVLWILFYAMPAHSQEYYTIDLQSDPYIDGNLAWKQYCDSVVFGLPSLFTPGDARDAFNGGNFYSRGYLTFPLDTIPDSLYLVRGTLNLYQQNCYGNDIPGLYPIWWMGVPDSCMVDHINYGPFLDLLDWTAGDSGDINTLIPNYGVISDDETLVWKSLDVTDCVQDDLALNHSWSQFRVHFNITTDWDLLGDQLVFTGSFFNPTNRPYLHLILEPFNSVFIKRKQMYSDPSGNQINSPSAIHISAFPNPFNAATVISFELLVIGHMKLEVFDIHGRQVSPSGSGTTPTTEYFSPGYHEITFDGSNLASGVYIYQLQVGDFVEAGKMVLMK